MLNKEWCSSPQALAVGHVAYPEWTSDPMVMAKGNEMGWAGWNTTTDAAALLVCGPQVVELLGRTIR